MLSDSRLVETLEGLNLRVYASGFQSEIPGPGA